MRMSLRGAVLLGFIFQLNTLHRTMAADPETIRVSIRATDPVASEAGPSTGLFTFQRSGPTIAPLTVWYQVSGSATGPGDYNPLPGKVEFRAGAATALILIAATDDAIAEEDETVVISLVAPPSGSGVTTPYRIENPDSATVTIRDNDLGVTTIPTVEITVADGSAAEPGSAGKFTISRLQEANTELRVDYDIVTSPISVPVSPASGPLVNAQIPAATSGGDYQPLPTFFVIPAGRRSITVNVQPIDDQLVEGSEHVTIRLRASSAYNVNAPEIGTVLLADNDPVTIPPAVSIKATQPRVLESDATHPGMFQVTRTGTLTTKLNVHYAVSGTAANGVDYQQLSGIVTLPAGERSAIIQVIPIPDKALERAETVILLLVPSTVVRPPSALPPEERYEIESPRLATATIYEELPNEKPKVSMTSPRNGATFVAGAAISLSAEATDSDGQIRDVTFFAGDRLIGSILQSPYTFSWNNVPAGRYELTARASDDRGGSTTSGTIRITVTEQIAGARLVPAGATWKYLDNGTDPTTAWRTAAFNDSAWPSGPAQLGYGDGDEATVLGFGSSPDRKYATTYFRRTFQVQDAASLTNAFIRLLRDDGAVVYLNGVELFRSNMPNGPVTPTTFAQNSVSGEAESAFLLFAIDAKLLVNGANILAVELHQQSVSSTDISFDLELLGNAPVPVRPQIVIDAPKEGATFRAPADITINATALDPKGYISRVNFFANGERIGVSHLLFLRAPDPGTPLHHTFEWKNARAGTYTINAQAEDTSAGLITSPAVKITVSPASARAVQQSLTSNREITFAGEIGRRYSIQSSVDLVSWVELATVESTDGTISYEEQEDAAAHRFYRAVPVED